MTQTACLKWISPLLSKGIFVSDDFVNLTVVFFVVEPCLIMTAFVIDGLLLAMNGLLFLIGTVFLSINDKTSLVDRVTAESEACLLIVSGDKVTPESDLSD